MAENQPGSYSYARVSTGSLRSWSQAWGRPYGPAATGYVDPRGAAPFDFVSVVVLFDGRRFVQSYALDQTTNVSHALYQIARALDEQVADLHAFSTDFAIHVQAVLPKVAKVETVAVSPYTLPPGQWALHAVALPESGDTALTYSAALDAEPVVFSVPRTANLDADYQALATKINAHPYLRAGRTVDGFLVHAIAGVSLLSDGVAYG